MIEYLKCLQQCNRANFPAAVEALTTLIAKGSPQAQYYNLRGYAYKNLSQNAKAIDDFSRAIQLKPDFVNAYCNRGESYSAQNKYQEAIQDFTTYINKGGRNLSAFQDRADLLLSLKKYQQAIKDYNRAIQMNPDDSYNYLQRASCYSKLYQQGQQAQRDYRHVIQLDPLNYQARSLLATLYFKQSAYKKAIEEINEAIKLKQKPEAYIIRGNAFQGLKRYKQAISDYDEAIKLNQNKPEGYNNKAIVLAAMGKNQEAFENYERALKADKNHTLTYYNRGNLFKRERQYDNAIKDYNQAIELKKQAKYYLMRGNAYLQKKQQDKAFQDYDQAIRLRKNDQKAYNCRAQAYVEQKNFGKAQKDFQKALELSNNNPLYLFNLANCYSKMNQQERANDYFQKGVAQISQADGKKLESKYNLSRGNIAYLKAQIKKYQQRKALSNQLKAFLQSLQLQNKQNANLVRLDQLAMTPVFMKTEYVAQQIGSQSPDDKLLKRRKEEIVKNQQTNKIQFKQVSIMIFNVIAQNSASDQRLTKMQKQIKRLSNKVQAAEQLQERIKDLQCPQLKVYYTYLFQIMASHFLAYRLYQAGVFVQAPRQLTAVDSFISRLCAVGQIATKVPVVSFFDLPLQIIQKYRQEKTKNLNQNISKKIKQSSFNTQIRTNEYLAYAVQNLIDNSEFNEQLQQAIKQKDLKNYLSNFVEMMSRVPGDISKKIFGNNQKDKFETVDQVIVYHLSLITLKWYQISKEEFVKASQDKDQFSRLILHAITTKVERKQVDEDSSSFDWFCCSKKKKADPLPSVDDN